MPNASSTRRPSSSGSPSSRQPRERESIRTWAFDSVGDKKYALQLQKAHNGNPCLRIVQGTPSGDGTYRKFDITIWSEDFPALFDNFEQVRQYVKANDIKTPPGHKYEPRRRPSH
jgi:hypothetical protein